MFLKMVRKRTVYTKKEAKKYIQPPPKAKKQVDSVVKHGTRLRQPKNEQPKNDLPLGCSKGLPDDSDGFEYVFISKSQTAFIKKHPRLLPILKHLPVWCPQNLVELVLGRPVSVETRRRLASAHTARSK